MKKSILATVIAATFLAGCSSSGSKNDDPTTPEPQVGIADVIYNEELNSALILGDEGNKALIIADGDGNADIKVNGQDFTVQGDVIVNDQGDIVGIVSTENGAAIAVINDTAYTLTVVDGRLVVDSSKHQFPTPDNDLPLVDGGIETDLPTYGNILVVDNTAVIEGDNGNHMFVVKHDDTYYFNINGTDARPTHKIVDGEVLTMDDQSTGIHTEKTENGVTFRTDNGTEIVFRNEDGRLFAAVIARPDIDNDLPEYGEGDWGRPELVVLSTENDSILIDGKDYGLTYESHDNGVTFDIKDSSGFVIAEANIVTLKDSDIKVLVIKSGESTIVVDSNGLVLANEKPLAKLQLSGLTNEQKAQIKDRVKSLSVEQRQQIKQAIKTKLQARS